MVDFNDIRVNRLISQNQPNPTLDHRNQRPRRPRRPPKNGKTETMVPRHQHRPAKPPLRLCFRR